MKFVPYGVGVLVVAALFLLGLALLNGSVIMSGHDLSETQLAVVGGDIAELNSFLSSLNEGLDKLEVATNALSVDIDEIAIDVADLDTKAMKATISLDKNINRSRVVMFELLVSMSELSERTDVLAEDGEVGCLFGMFRVETPNPDATWTRPVLLCGSGLFYQIHGEAPGDVIGPLPEGWSFEPLDEEELRRAGFPPKIEIFN